MLRFDAKTGYYLYPEVEGIKDLRLQLNRGITFDGDVSARNDICVIKHGLRIPVFADSYDAFVIKMAASEQEFRMMALR